MASLQHNDIIFLSSCAFQLPKHCVFLLQTLHLIESAASNSLTMTTGVSVCHFSALIYIIIFI